MNEQRTHILLADDDINLSTVLADYLHNAGFLVDTVHDGKSALEAIRSSAYDLCLLDINMPQANGFEVLRDLNRTSNELPVIVLSARQAREDIIRAFELGCDDYVTKPFSMDILICRIKAVIRRAQKGGKNEETIFKLGNKVFDSTHQTIDGQHLSGRESDLLLMLCRHMNQLVDRHVLLVSLWKTDDYFTSRSLSVYINHLRSFLEDTDVQILGVHKKGYKLVQA